MIKMKRLHEKGEVATILAISAVIVIGISMISSAFFGGKKQSTSSRADEVCGPSIDNSTCPPGDAPVEDNQGKVTCCHTVAVNSPTPPPSTNGIPYGCYDPGMRSCIDACNDGYDCSTPNGVALCCPFTGGGAPTTTQTAPTTAPASTDLCGGSNGACKDNCGSGNDCVKYLESVSVPGLSDGSVINTDSFSCDIVTKNVAGVRTDTDNICGVKVNDQWPAWCPWDGVGQYMCGATITSRANCNLKSSHFSSTPVKAGDKLQVVAARKAGSCGNIPWNTAGSFITGPTFYYKQKGGGSTNTTPQATTAPQTPRATTAPQQPQPTTISQTGNITPKPTEQTSPGGATPAKDPSVTPIVNAKGCNTALGPNKSLLVIPEGKTMCIDTSLFGGTLGNALYKCNSGTPPYTTYDGTCLKCNASGDGCEAGSTGSIDQCINTTCNDTCKQFDSGAGSPVGNTEISYSKAGNLLSFYEGKDCQKMAPIPNTKTRCKCEKYTTINIENRCPTTIFLQKITYLWIFKKIEVNEDILPGKSKSISYLDSCFDTAYIDYTRKSSISGNREYTRYMVPNINCNGLSNIIFDRDMCQ